MAREMSVIELANILGGRIVGDIGGEDSLLGTCAVDNYVKGKVSFIKNPKYGEMLAELHDAVIVVPESLSALCEKYPQNIYVVVEDIAGSIVRIQDWFYADSFTRDEDGICKTAKVDPSVSIGHGAYIGENVFIGRDVVVGQRTKIMHNSCIFDNVVIGSETYIYPSVCIYKNCQIGNDCLIHSGARIGPDGFRFEQDIRSRIILKMIHVGKVIIGDRVEIGANTAIDRATFEDSATILSDDVKVDNLVHIGHNARIGARSIIAALSCIGGSDVIGEDVWIGIGVTISNNVSVGDRAKVLLNAVVAYDVPEDEIVSGFYAMPHRQWKRVYKKLKGE